MCGDIPKHNIGGCGFPKQRLTQWLSERVHLRIQLCDCTVPYTGSNISIYAYPDYSLVTIVGEIAFRKSNDYERTTL